MGVNKKTYTTQLILNTGTSKEAFLDRAFTHSYSIPLISLAQPREFLDFNGLSANSKPVTYIAKQHLYIPGYLYSVLTTFYITDIPDWDLIIGLPWMQRNEVNLYLRLEGNSIFFGGLKSIDTKKPSIPLFNPKPPATLISSQVYELH